MSLGDLLLPSVFRPRLPRLRLGNPERLPFDGVPTPEARLLRVEARTDEAPPRPGEPIGAGEPLGHLGRLPVLCPLAATVAEVRPVNHLYGGTPGFAVVLEPAPDGKKLEPLAPLGAEADRSEILERLESLGVPAYGSGGALPLAEVLGSGMGGDPEAVVLSAVDPEPLLASGRRLLEEHLSEIEDLLALLRRGSGAEVVLAVPASHEGMARKGAPGAKVVAVPDRYPEGLDELVARRAVSDAAKGPVVVVSIESALAAHVAVTRGLPPTDRYITVIGADESCRNVKVPYGTPVGAVFDHLSMAVEGLDLVAAGGPMRGRGEPLLDAAVDSTTAALMVMAEAASNAVDDDPCISCGSCVEVCPMQLQPQLLGRNAEFGFFERNAELDLDCCVRCGLCAYVCPSGRPLLQWIELTAAELEAAARAEEGA